MTALRKSRPGNISEIRKLQPVVFSGIEKPLDAEHWLIEVANFMSAVRIPDEDQVEVAEIQLRDVERTWWLVEEAKLEKPITWDQFSKSFYKGFFPDGIKRDERTIYQITVGGPNCSKVCCKVPKT